MEENKSSVYVYTDNQKRILRCEGGYTLGNIKNFTGWTLIDKGNGDRYNLCQSHYFVDGLYTEDGILRYKLVENAAQARTEEEIQADRDAMPKPVIPPTNSELEAENKILKAQLQAATDRQDFLEDCIAEMAMQVYAV
ncbi:hypothetical protein [Anaeromassilibacillus sp. An200]|uniref:hypothetical protein n=1 Tax=Anaeromassilibacillus sp. An200 TaxID=1965587 RepID=UPI000B3A9920|nr:hypothetical protein [Anaeromassilibacillus sp. An200]OUP06240.1 hypothetical protein B5F35_15685 [Anaeromassilibacillus sp. An200]